MSDVKEKEVEQLSLDVKVPFLTTLRNNVTRFRRNISVSPLAVAVKNPLLWVNTGMIIALQFLIRSYSEVLSVGKGVLLGAGYYSQLPTFVSRSIVSFMYYEDILLALLVFHFLYVLFCVVLIIRGRFGILGYIFLFETVVLLAIAKTILSPLILLGW